MSRYVSAEQETLIRALYDRKVTPSDFANRYPIPIEQLPTLGSRILDESFLTRDAEDVRTGLRMGWALKTTLGEEYEDVLLRLSAEPWHFSHEDVATALDELCLRDPRVANAFRTLATSSYPYLKWDDNYALGVKCIWGLGNMGTVEAIEVLGDLLKLDNPIFDENVEEQLDKIEGKQPSEAVLKAIHRAREKMK